MKIYCVNYNNVLDGIIPILKEKGQWTDNYHLADVFLIWQDVRGECKELADVVQNHLGKPVIVMQHGRGAVRDYGPPNKFPLTADKILVWGPAEKRRLLSYGIAENRIEVVGCPLIPLLKPPNNERKGKNVVFCPVITQKEEPENILVYATLKKWESEKLIENIYELFPKMKKAWAVEENQFRTVKLPDGTTENRLWGKQINPTLPRYVTYAKGLLNIKLTGIHDFYQYHAPIVHTEQGSEDHMQATIDLLRNTDVLVCLEEGTMQGLACALDIPVILVDIFTYGTYGGTQDYDRVEKINTPAVYRTNKIEKIGALIDNALEHKEELRKQRIKVCEDEFGANLGAINDNIIRAIERAVNERNCHAVAV